MVIKALSGDDDDDSEDRDEQLTGAEREAAGASRTTETCWGSADVQVSLSIWVKMSNQIEFSLMEALTSPPGGS